MRNLNSSGFLFSVASIRVLLVCLVVTAGGGAFAADLGVDQLSGVIVGITDGDTIVMVDGQDQQFKIRLADIDAPERRQPFYQKSRQMLAEMAFRKNAVVTVVDTDRYGRLVGRVVVGDLDVNAAMIRLGGAWVYRKYLREPALLDVEQVARTARLGLWSLPEAERVPPWEWRRNRRDVSAETPAADCLIKGNISRSGRIYHVPGSMHYDRTVIDTGKGERWFCTEQEAIEAGWRAPRG